MLSRRLELVGGSHDLRLLLQVAVRVWKVVVLSTILLIAIVVCFHLSRLPLLLLHLNLGRRRHLPLFDLNLFLLPLPLRLAPRRRRHRTLCKIVLYRLRGRRRRLLSLCRPRRPPNVVVI